MWQKVKLPRRNKCRQCTFFNHYFDYTCYISIWIAGVVNMDFGLEFGRPEVTLRTRSVTGSVTLIPAALPLSASRDSGTDQVRCLCYWLYWIVICVLVCIPSAITLVINSMCIIIHKYYVSAYCASFKFLEDIYYCIIADQFLNMRLNQIKGFIIRMTGITSWSIWGQFYKHRSILIPPCINTGQHRLLWIFGFQRCLWENMSNFIVSTVPANSPAESGIRTSAGTMMARFRSHIDTGPASRGLKLSD